MSSQPPRFLIDGRPAPGDRLALAAEETRHAHVRRLRRGETVEVFDGSGRSYRGVVAALARDAAEITITEELPAHVGESPLELTLALAVLKNDRLEWVIEKATELGVHAIRPFTSQFSLARPSEARWTRWRQIARSAAKQCGRTVLPHIESPVAWESLLRDPSPCRLLCWEDGGRALADLVPKDAVPQRLTLAIGPEGGFSAAEVDAARAAGWLLLHLGPRVLRADTAALAALALCQYQWGDLAGPRAAAPPG